MITTVGRGSAMEKWLCLGTMGVAGLLLLVFLLDLVADARDSAPAGGQA